MAVAGGGRWLFMPFVCAFYARYHDILKLDAARIVKLGVEMFHDESWKPIYFGVRRSRVKVTSHKNIAGVDLCPLLSAGF